MGSKAKLAVVASGTLLALCCQSKALGQRPYNGTGNPILDRILNADNPAQSIVESLDASRRAAESAYLARMASSADPERDRQIEATYEMLDQGIDTFIAGNPQVAIDVYFDPLLAVFEETIAAQPLPTYVARSDREGMYYILTAAGQGKNVQAIGSYGPDAYYWKALALEAEGDVDNAQSALDRALELSPANSWFRSQRAIWLQSDGNLLQALADFERAAEVARLFSPPSARAAELGHALRGRAYILVELARFEDAALLYEECIELDAEDREAAVQLAYVRNVIERRRGRGN